jgi:BAAT / Acyl-CoA thioester hydrolase C terminal
VRRGRAKGARFPIRHLGYPDAWHMFTRPAGFRPRSARCTPIMGENIAYGGSVAGNAHASADSWLKIVGFLRDSLPASGSQP